MAVIAEEARERAGPRQLQPERATVSLEPASAYEAVTRQMVLGLTEDLREIKARLNGLLFLVAGSVLLDLLSRGVLRGP
ncbi:MAG: hypothetical protein KC442_05170 [Thermomicrobiales bacterium]|nr:hypothetical protein [Thermomicrobiales bacterium]